MSQLIKDDTGKIKAIRITDAVFSYSYLTMPRPEGQFKAGSYGTELIIRDQATVEMLNQYLKEVIAVAKVEAWNGKVPKDTYIPFEEGDDEAELEKDAYVLKTTSPKQPPLFIRNEDEVMPHRVTEEEIEEIYAGMIGEAYVVFAPFNYNGKTGITAYLNGVCKTGKGTPFGGKANLEEIFANPAAGGLDFSAPVKPKKAVEEEVKDEELDLSQLTKKKPHAAAPAVADHIAPSQKLGPVVQTPTAPRATKKLTVADLI